MKRAAADQSRSSLGLSLWLRKGILACWICLLPAVGSLLFPSMSQAYFQDLGMGVRPVGMGEAFVAVADDSNTMLWNAAGLADIERREINLMYSDLYSNLNARLYSGENDSLGFHNVGLVLPFGDEIGGFGFTWTIFNTKLYRENSFIFGYGREIGQNVFEWFQASEQVKQIRLSAGMNLKVLNWMVVENEFTRENPVFRNGLTRTGFTADLGLLAEWTQNVKVGFSFENFIPSNVGLTMTETVPVNLRLGTSYLHDFKKSIQYLDSVLGALDVTYRNEIADVRVGAEGWFFDHLIALRLGTTVDQFTTGLSVNAQLPASPVDMRLDYAFGYPYSIKATWGSHRFSLVVSWGKGVHQAQPTPEPEVQIEPEENLAAKREKELAAERAQDEAKLKAMMEKMRGEIQDVRSALDQVKEQIQLSRIPAIQFESGQAILKQGSFQTLDQIGTILQRYPDIKLRFEGHTDAQGKAEYNKRLSQSRVEAVKEYLIGKYDLNSSNLIALGYGETQPIASNQTPEGRATNRRVEIKVLLPTGMDEYFTPTAISDTSAAEAIKEPLRPEDVATYEEIEKLREKLKVYEMQMNPEEVEQMFEEQHRGNNEPPKPAP